jgi:hypothetical protein
MKALSILQPWAWLIVRPDLTDTAQRARAAADGLIKDIENRSWRTPYRGYFLVHAGKTYPRIEHEDQARWIEADFGIVLPHYEQMQRGGVVGQARIVDCVRDHASSWKVDGSWGFVLTEQKPLAFAPFRGQLGWFDIPRDIVAAAQTIENAKREQT